MFSAFSKQQQGFGGRCSVCRVCRIQEAVERRKDPAVKEREREWYKEYMSDPDVREARRLWHKEHNALSETKAWRKRWWDDYKVRPDKAERRREVQREYARRLDVKERVSERGKRRRGKRLQQFLEAQDYLCNGRDINFACAVNLTNDSSTHLDHIVPASRGGSNEDDNFQALCANCNAKKYTKTMVEWREENKIVSNTQENVLEEVSYSYG